MLSRPGRGGAGRGGGGAWVVDIIGYRNIFYGDYR